MKKFYFSYESLFIVIMHGTNNFAIACLVYQITNKVELVVLFPEVASKNVISVSSSTAYYTHKYS